MKEKKSVVQFRVADSVKQFLKKLNPSNTSQAIGDLLVYQKETDEAALLMFDIYKEPEKTLRHIRQAIQDNTPLDKKYYCFTVDKIHALAKAQPNFIIAEECMMTLVQMMDAFYKAIIASGRKVDLGNSILAKLPDGSKSFESGLEIIEEKILTKQDVSLERVMRISVLLLTQETGANGLDYHSILYPYIETLHCLLHKAVAYDIEHEGDLFRAFKFQKENARPILYGSNNGVHKSVCTASLYKGNIISENIIVVLKKTDVGNASVTKFIEDIAKSVTNQCMSEIDLTKVTWYELSTSEHGVELCDLVRFGTISPEGYKEPSWIRVDFGRFSNMIDTLEPICC